MKLLELFCGTKSISKEFEKVGFQVTTLDITESFEPTICRDILTISDDYFAGYGFDCVWASPPCETFSVLRIGRNWNYDHTPKNQDAARGLAMLEKTVAIIKAINPRLFWIENPRGKMRRMECLQKFTRRTVTYCQYGDTRQKPTDIWTNSNWEPRPMCRNGDLCHEPAPRGAKTGNQGLKGSALRSVIPAPLCREIAEYAVGVTRPKVANVQMELFGELFNDPQIYKETEQCQK